MPAERAQCAVVVPAGLGAGSTFVVDLFDGKTITVKVPAGKGAGDTLVIGSASTVVEAESIFGKGQLSRICNVSLTVPAEIPGDRHLYVGTPFGGVYLCRLPAGVGPGEKVTVQVPVYVEDEPAPSPAAAPPPALKHQGSSTLTMALDRLDSELETMELDSLLDRLDDDVALVDEEIQRYFVAGLEEVAGTVTMASAAAGGSEVQHVVVGKLVRHRTDKWLRLNRERSAHFDKHASATDSAVLKERPGRQRHRGGLLAGARKAWTSLKSVRLPSKKPPKPVQV